MKKSRYYRNGKLHEGEPDKIKESSMAKGYDHDKQRREHAADIVQPYNSDGSLNQEFEWLYPEQAEMYKRGNK